MWPRRMRDDAVLRRALPLGRFMLSQISMLSLSFTLIYHLQMSLEIWKVGQSPTEIADQNKGNNISET